MERMKPCMQSRNNTCDAFLRVVCMFCGACTIVDAAPRKKGKRKEGAQKKEAIC